MRRGIRASLAAIAAATLLIAAPARAEFTPGATSLDTPFFPTIGNGGYQVDAYDLDLRYTPKSHRLVATATITAVASQDLSAFSLDYAGPAVRSVEVGGVPATFEQGGRKLVITPASGILNGTVFSAEVSYAGRPHPFTDPDGSKEGWFSTADGAFVVGEPLGSMAWYPSNNVPTDKAMFSFRVSVPKGVEAVANGRLVSVERGGRAVWSWRTTEPMATYLATVGIGQFRLLRGKAAGITSVSAVDAEIPASQVRSLRRTPAILRLFSRLFGPYPFRQTGAIVDRAGRVGYALETQTRPLYPGAPDDVLLAHELAHQWFGDSVTPSVWPDIWLNEGFATWAEWRWRQEAGGPSTGKTFTRLLRTPASNGRFWSPAPAELTGPAELFVTSVYERGAMALEALRKAVGNATFYATMRAWVAAHAYGNATIEDFIALAEAQAGQQLDGLFATWLEAPGKPPVG